MKSRNGLSESGLFKNKESFLIKKRSSISNNRSLISNNCSLISNNCSLISNNRSPISNYVPLFRITVSRIDMRCYLSNSNKHSLTIHIRSWIAKKDSFILSNCSRNSNNCSLISNNRSSISNVWRSRISNFFDKARKLKRRNRKF